MREIELLLVAVPSVTLGISPAVQARLPELHGMVPSHRPARASGALESYIHSQILQRHVSFHRAHTLCSKLALSMAQATFRFGPCGVSTCCCVPRCTAVSIWPLYTKPNKIQRAKEITDDDTVFTQKGSCLWEVSLRPRQG